MSEQQQRGGQGPFGVQEETMRQGQRAFSQAVQFPFQQLVELQRNASEMFLNALEIGDSMQRRGTDLTRAGFYSYLDAIEDVSRQGRQQAEGTAAQGASGGTGRFQAQQSPQGPPMAQQSQQSPGSQQPPTASQQPPGPPMAGQGVGGQQPPTAGQQPPTAGQQAMPGQHYGAERPSGPPWAEEPGPQQRPIEAPPQG